MECRIVNVALESNEARCPISGLFSRFKRPTPPFFTFLEAIQDVLSDEELSHHQTIHGMSREELESVSHTLMGMAREKKEELGASCPLNEHEIAALYLYTSEFFDGECFYAAINGLLRNKNRINIKPFTRIIWLTVLASSKCPPFTGHTLHRGIKTASSDELRAVKTIYADGRTVTWGQFSSCSTSLNIQNEFLGQSGYRMLFNIEVNHDNSVPNNARKISQMSLMPSEEEVILPPNTRVLVVGSYFPSPDMVIVSLRVVPSLDNIFPNVDMPRTVSVRNSIPSVVNTSEVFDNGNRDESYLLNGKIGQSKGVKIAKSVFPSTYKTGSEEPQTQPEVRCDVGGASKQAFGVASRVKSETKSSGTGRFTRFVPLATTESASSGEPPTQFYIQSISAMKAYEMKSFEEIRLEDYEMVQTGGLGECVDTSPNRKSVLTLSKKQGKGTMVCISIDGNRYHGGWINDSKSGKGVFTWANGDRFDGNFEDDKRHGKGTMVYANGDKYQGDWVDNSRTGKGVFTWANGDRYEGDFEGGKRHGKGTMVYANGDRYQGDWINDLISGKGVFTWANGDRFEGDFENGKKQDNGTMVYANGDRKQGDKVNNSRAASGTKAFTAVNKNSLEETQPKPGVRCDVGGASKQAFGVASRVKSETRSSGTGRFRRFVPLATAESASSGEPPTQFHVQSISAIKAAEMKSFEEIRLKDNEMVQTGGLAELSLDGGSMSTKSSLGQPAMDSSEITCQASAVTVDSLSVREQDVKTSCAEKCLSFHLGCGAFTTSSTLRHRKRQTLVRKRRRPGRPRYQQKVCS